MSDLFRRSRPAADFSSPECAARSPEDREQLWDAATRLVEARGMVVRLTAWLSQHIQGAAGGLDALGHRLFGASWDIVEAKVREAIEEVLSKAHDLAAMGLGLHGERDSWIWLNRLCASASGAVTGFVGLPGLMFDIPVTTTLMLRSIAEIAREHGEDIASAEGRRACLEVLAQGGPKTEMEEAEIGYWTTRASLSHLSIAALTRTVAAQFGVRMSETVLARMVPVAGAVAGGGLNWVFMGYYHEMARVHFTLREIERRTGDPEGVRACFDRLVAQARALKNKGPDIEG